MNLSPRWVGVLADAGFAAAHWSALGAKAAPDSEIMAYARANGFVVLTHDLDFGAILAATRGEKPSVVQIRAEDVSPDVIGRQVIAALRQMESELEEGALLTVDPNRTRLRVLPLRRG
jgi:predicted nuclease of predicted toxin-antitoxin system